MTTNGDGRLLEMITTDLGSTIRDALSDAMVTDIMRNGDGRVWIHRHDTGMKVAGEMTDADARALIGSVAHSLEMEANTIHPIVEGELILDGSRFEGVLPPATPAPIFAIRKRASQVFDLDDYVIKGIISERQRDFLADAVRTYRNILIAGGTGSGKTTFANALIACIAKECPDDRIVIIEDTAEIQCASPNVAFLRTSPYTSMQALLRTSMRLFPDRVMVGEVRGAEALDLLKAWGTGHPGGIGTVHAEDVPGALMRMKQLVGEAGAHHGARELITQTVDIVAVLEGKRERRSLSHLAKVKSPEMTDHWKLEEWN